MPQIKTLVRWYQRSAQCSGKPAWHSPNYAKVYAALRASWLSSYVMNSCWLSSQGARPGKEPLPGGQRHLLAGMSLAGQLTGTTCLSNYRINSRLPTFVRCAVLQTNAPQKSSRA